MNRIVGYTNRASVAPGEEISFHVSLLSDDPRAQTDYRARLVRIAGFDADAGEERVEPIRSPLDSERFVARVEQTAGGSYGTADLQLDAGADGDSLTIQAGFQPTQRVGGEQCLISLCSAAGGELALVLDSELRPLLIATNDGTTESDEVRLQGAVALHDWYTATASVDYVAKTATLRLARADGTLIAESCEELEQLPRFARATAFLATRGRADVGQLRPSSFFTGRIEDPLVATSSGPLDPRSPSMRARAVERSGLLALWDLGAAPESFELIDISGREQHGVLHGVPQCAVTGSNWDGETRSIHAAREQYRAAHFWADAIEDAGWPAACSLRIPADLRSGLYAITLEMEGDKETIPFSVLPTPETDARLVLLLPTATYMAYSNARFTWEKVNWEVQRDRTVELGRSEQILLDHPGFGSSSYDQYLDGANTTFISWLRPNLDMRVAQRRAENYPSDLQLIDWLEEKHYRYDVVTDQDLDRGGAELLSPYRVVLTGSHPEYVSSRMVEALTAFVASGGRLAVLGGNALHFKVAFSVERPWLMEVRKSWNRPAGSRAVAEGELSLTGEYTADPDAPRPGEQLLGTSTASMGFDGAQPYERLPEADDPGAAFVFAGVEADVIGDGGPFAAAVHQEWDNTVDVGTGQLEGFGEPLVLARSRESTLNARWFGATKRQNRAEMVLRTTDSGGAVFSVASMAWCLCLHLEDVSQITVNVIDRFLDQKPFASG